MSGSPVKACLRCGKERQVNYDRRNYCIECRDDTLRPIANWMEHGACRAPFASKGALRALPHPCLPAEKQSFLTPSPPPLQTGREETT